MIGERIKLVRQSQDKKLTQEEFGDMLGVSRSVIANAELGRVEPNELFIQHLCSVFDVDENWLRTGEGEMRRKKTREEELASFFGKIITMEDSSFLRRFCTALSKLSDEQLEKLSDIGETLMQEMNEDKK